MARHRAFGEEVGKGVSVPSNAVVLAAGVVLLRHETGYPEVLIVHRPHRSDWSLPKGKLEPGEHVIAAAVRECDEETGHHVVLGARLPTQEYQALNLPKQVDYWVARTDQDEGFIPHDEIDEIRWIPASTAHGILTYAHDAALVDRAVLLPRTSPLIVLRHTQAVKRSDYSGKVDAERPISGRGRSQARALVPLLEAFGVEEIVSSPSTRCHQSVRKLAKSLSLPIQHVDALSEESHDRDADRTAKQVRRLVRNPAPMVVCTHRPVLPTVMSTIRETADVDDTVAAELFEPKMPPGGFVIFHRAFGPDRNPRIVAVERHLTTIDE